MATTSTERQRKRRARLKADGFVDVTVTVPRDKAAAVRRFARGMMASQDRLAIVLRTLRDNRANLEALGVTHAGVFGSTARGDYRPDSDVDVLIEMDPNAKRGMLDLLRAVGAIRENVQHVLPGIGVDVVQRETLQSRLRPSVEAEVVRGF
ncbi:MAG: nucleotidyltransferase domain-containing protein [Rhodospirillales bacterium]